MKLKVNQTLSEDGVDRHLIEEDYLVEENLKILGLNAQKIINSFTSKGESAYTFARIKQLVMIMRYDLSVGFSAEFIDFNNNIDHILDEYLDRESKSWNVEDLNRISEIALDIINNPSETISVEVI